MGIVSAIPVSIPRLQPGFVIRPELDAMLDALAPGEWLSVVAPAGFGKSQLAAYWHERAIAAGIDCAWGAARDSAALCLLDDADDAPVDLPEGVRLVTFGRSPPQSRRVPTATIGAESLRLSLSASAALVRARGGVATDHFSLAAYEGWPPALNLLAQGAAGTQALQAFLETHVMAGLTPADCAALADLALLSDLRVPLVEAALDRADGAALLDHLVRQTPFFRTIDGTVSLAAFARRFLLDRARTAPAAPVHQRCAAWLIERAPLTAVPHLLALGDLDRAARILGERLFEMVTGGDLSSAIDWLDQIGPDRIFADPGLSLGAAHVYATAGDHARANLFLASHGVDERLVLQCTVASHADDVDTAAHIIQQVADPAGLDPMTSAIHRNMISWIDQKLGRWSEARNRTLLGSSRRHPELLLIQSYGRCRAARWALSQGHAAAAIKALAPLLDEADARLGRASAPSALIASTLAYARLQAGETDAATQDLAGRTDAFRLHNVASTWAMALITESRLAAMRGEFDEATAALDILDSLASSRDVFSVQALVIAERIRLMVRAGPLAGTMTLAGALERLCRETRDLRVNGPHVRLEALIGLGHLARAQGNAPGGQRLFEEALGIAIARQRLIDGAEILLACPEAVPAAQRAAITRTVHAADLVALGRRLGRPVVEQPPMPCAAQDEVRMLDRSQPATALTARERDVLAQLGLHHSNKMIAREIGLSGETVKWHVANLLAKLGARDRTHALERARALGLLPSALARPGAP